MKPVQQTRFGEEGNCHAACIASIFEVPIESVPQPNADEVGSDECWPSYLERLQTEFFAPRGLCAMSFAYGTGEEWHRPPGYAILGEESWGATGMHAVVCRDGEVVWDPSPDRSEERGLPVEWTVFLFLDPARITAANTFQEDVPKAS